MRRVRRLIVLGLIASPSGTAWAQNATTPGAVTLPYPTTMGLSIEWAIAGDANNNGIATVRYRESSSSDWRTGMNLIRVPAGSNATGDFGSGGGKWGNKLAGSLFDLAPGKTYEIDLTLTDPDGGSMTVSTTGATRAIPAVPADAKTKPVTPSTFASTLASAAPGDLLLLGPGTYAPFAMARSGIPDRPIVIRGESADTVVFSPGRVTLNDRSWIYLEDLTIQGEIRMNGASNMVVRRCKIRTGAGGITFEIGNQIPRNNYIVDNDVVGAANWTNDQLGADGYDGGEGIQFTGSGHVVCFNHVKGFRDNISLMEYDEAYEQVSIDICNNDIEQATDDGIEADSAMGNVRVVRNRIRNCFDGCSSQPGLGGPTFFIRNAMFNVLYTPFKFHNGTVGDVVLHNTVVKCGDAFGCYAGEPWSRAFFRNNIFIGGAGGGTYGGYSNGTGRIFDLADADATCSFDYDGVGAIGISTFEGKIGNKRFTSLATLQSNTTEAHAVQVDMSIFAAPVAFPSSPFPPKDVVDLRPSPDSVVVDRGLPISGVNDDFAGKAPDLGAYEAGQALPVYGPRTFSDTGGTGGSSGADSSTVPNTGGASGGRPPMGTGGVTSGNSSSLRTGGTVDDSAGTGGAISVPPVGGLASVTPAGGTAASADPDGRGTDGVVSDAGVAKPPPVANADEGGCSCDLATSRPDGLAEALSIIAALAIVCRLPLRRRQERPSGMTQS